MKIRSIHSNNKRKAFLVQVGKRTLPFPFVKASPPPTRLDAVTSVVVDEDTGRESFTYELASGAEGTIHVEQVLEYNQDPNYLRDLLLYRMTLEARRRIERSPLSKRELVRRLGTSATQLYRLLDATNYRKSIDQMIRLLHALDCEVELRFRAGTA